MSGEPITIDVVSDVVCPWCFVGKNRLQRALDLVDLDVEVRWHPYQLDPTVPVQGMDRLEYLRRKFGSDADIERLHAPLRAVGREEGIPFAFDRITRSPNTLDAHRLIHWSTATGRQNDMVNRLFEAYFLEGADLTDHEILAGLAPSGGIETEVAARMLASDTDRAEVEASANAAREMGITGVPTFIIGRRLAVVGAREPEVIAGAIRKVAESHDGAAVATR